MNGENISNISPSPYSPKGKGVKAGARQPVQKKDKGEAAVSPKDSVDLSKAVPEEVVEEAAFKVSQEDLARYVAQLNEEPEIREDEVERVKGRLARGDYGKEALEETVRGISEELGFPPEE